MELLAITLMILFVFSYIFYPLILLLIKQFIRNNNSKSTSFGEDFLPRVSILIAAYNEERVIAEKIENCKNLEYPEEKIEIVVASDGSDDKTTEIVKDLAEINSNIVLFEYTERAGKVNVLNKTIPQCTGEIIFLSDANAIYNKDAIKNAISHFENPKVGCVAGEKRITQTAADKVINRKEGLYWKLESLIKSLESDISTVIGADGALYAIRKELFEQLPRETSVDDFLLSMLIVRKGYKIAYEPNAYSCEESADSYDKEYKRKVRIAAGNFFNLKFLYDFLKPNFKSFMFISHKLLRWISPFVLILLTLSLFVLSLNSIYWKFVFVAFLLSYIIAALGYVYRSKNKIISFLSYFYMTVFAQLIGFLKYLCGSQKAIWEKMR